jgi:hypothetical protein
VSTDTLAPAPEDLEAYRATTQTSRDDATVLRLGPERITFAAGDADLIVGMAVCKPGVFNGVFEVTRDDLDAWVARFEELRGVLRPPMRLDHGWSVTEVIGRFEALRVENRPDPAAGGAVVPMLVGDWRIVGTPDERRLIREWIKGDKLNERSSEFWSYRTNVGAEYPSVFAGCAFVDIPAVEGLGAITLRRAGGTLSATPEEGAHMADEQPTPTDDDVETPPTGDTVTPAGGDVADAADETPASDPHDVDPDGTGDPADDAGDPPADAEPEPADDDAPSGEVPPTELAAQLRAAGVTDADALRTIEAAVELRVARRLEAETRLSAHTARGVIPLGVRPQVEALLRHDDQAVRDGIDALLAATAAPVKLRAEAGTLSATVPSEGGATSPDELRELSATELGPVWAALTSEQRKSPEYLAAYRAVTGTDYRR